MEEYLEQHKLMHEQAGWIFNGSTTAKDYKETLRDIMTSKKPSTLLDYGCGKGMQYHKHKLHEDWGCEIPALYDPCYEPYASKPEGNFDGVICIDVLEHVPEEHLGDVIKDIYSYATEFVFVAVATFKAGKSLPNGKNCHATVKPMKWWGDKFKACTPQGAVELFLYGMASKGTKGRTVRYEI